MMNGQEEILQSIHKAIVSQSSREPTFGSVILPIFDGHPDNCVILWLTQINAIFMARNVPIMQRFGFIMSGLSHTALQWYTTIYASAADKSTLPFSGDWQIFQLEFRKAFSRPNRLFHLRKKLKNLKQQDDILDYVYKFRNLVIQIEDMAENDKIVYFIEGLKDRIRNKLSMEPPDNMETAVTLAVNYHTSLSENARVSTSYEGIVPMEINAMREQKQCGFCKKFGHIYSECRIRMAKKGKREEINKICEENSQEIQNAPNKNDVVSYPMPKQIKEEEILLNEKYGTQLLSFYGTVNNTENIEILIDSGATNNFISEELVKRIRIPTMNTKPFQIRVANGDPETIKYCTEPCSVEIQEFKDMVCCNVLKMGKERIILGKSWLRKHNPAIDWVKDSIQFKKQNITITKSENTMIWRSKRLVNLIEHVGKQTEEIFLVAIAKSEERDFEKTSDQELKKIMQRYKELFTDKNPMLPPDRNVVHTINTGDHEPIYRNSYRMSPLELDELKRQLKELCDVGYIETSSSPWASPVLFVKKKDGSLRLCVDYRAINAITVKNKYPIPRVDEILDRLHNANYFSKLDLKSGYHQVLLHEKDREKTAFNTRYGQFQFKVLPFGLTNAPPSFMSLMNTIFRKYLDDFVLIYLDDILIFSKTKSEHFEHVKKVLQTIEDNKLYLNAQKCEFLLQEVEFLGYTIGNNAVKPSPAKTACIKDWPAPKNKKEVRSFLGLCGYYRRFVPNFAAIAVPLTELTKEENTFQFYHEEEKAFATLKSTLIEHPILQLPNFEKEFIIETDASGLAIGAVISQEIEGKLLPIAYESKKLNTAEQKYPVHEQELYAIFHACKTFRCYVEGRKFKVYTDHASLKYLKTQSCLSRRVTRWMQFLEMFDMDIIYKKGTDNTVADALSRIPYDDQINLLDDSDWPLELLRHLEEDYIPEDDKTKRLIEDNRHKFTCEDGVLYRTDKENRLAYVPFIFRADLISNTHRSLGHLGYQAIYEHMRKRYWFPEMESFIKNTVKTCIACQKVSNVKHAIQDELHPLPVVPAFHRWSLDFIGILPETEEGNRWIITGIDHATKWPVARATKTASSEEVVRFVYEEILLRFGCPVEILTDRGANFLSDMVEDYLSKQKIKHLKTSAYHPRTNGALERFNGLFGRMLSRYCYQNTKTWDKFIDQALFACRVRTHKATGKSPFYLVYGLSPKVPGDLLYPFLNLDVTNEEAVYARVEELEKLGFHRDEAREKVRHEQELIKRKYDESVEYFEFYPGDFVFLQNLNPVKFKNNYEGPFAVIKKGPMGTYQLLNQTGDIKESLVHVGRLKLAYLEDKQIEEIFSEKAKLTILKLVREFEEEEEVSFKKSGMLAFIE